MKQDVVHSDLYGNGKSGDFTIRVGYTYVHLLKQRVPQINFTPLKGSLGILDCGTGCGLLLRPLSKR